MPGKKKPSAKPEKHPSKRPIEQYDHKSKTRINNPSIGLVNLDTEPVVPSRKSYDYDPHLEMDRSSRMVLRGTTIVLRMPDWAARP